MEAQGSYVGPAPSVRSLLHVLLVLDPSGRFPPLSFLTDPVQFVQLDEHLVRRMVVHFFKGVMGYATFLLPAYLDRRMSRLVTPHTARIVASVRLQVVDVQFLKGACLFRLYAHSPRKHTRPIRETSSRSFPPLWILLERVFSRFVMMSSAIYNYPPDYVPLLVKCNIYSLEVHSLRDWMRVYNC